MSKHIQVLDLSHDNIILLKIDKSVFGSNKHVVLCGTYICPPDSPYYRQAHIDFTSAISELEETILNCIQTLEQPCTYLLCGDFSARTGCLNAVPHESEDDLDTLIQSELCENRQ